MPSVIRTLLGRPEPAPLAKQGRRVMESRIGSVSGFAVYYLVQTVDDAASITVCEDPHGVDASAKRAETWLRDHVPDLRTPAAPSLPGDNPFLFAQSPAMI